MLIYCMIVGVVSGIMAGFFGVGGGLILVPAFIYLFHFNIHMAVGTSLLVIVPTALVGAWRHWGYQHVDWHTALWVGLFAALGAMAGAYLTTKISSSLLQKLFALFLLGVSLHLLLRK